MQYRRPPIRKCKTPFGYRLGDTNANVCNEVPANFAAVSRQLYDTEDGPLYSTLDQTLVNRLFEETEEAAEYQQSLKKRLEQLVAQMDGIGEGNTAAVGELTIQILNTAKKLRDSGDTRVELRNMIKKIEQTKVGDAYVEYHDGEETFFINTRSHKAFSEKEFKQLKGKFRPSQVVYRIDTNHETNLKEALRLKKKFDDDEAKADELDRTQRKNEEEALHAKYKGYKVVYEADDTERLFLNGDEIPLISLDEQIRHSRFVKYEVEQSNDAAAASNNPDDTGGGIGAPIDLDESGDAPNGAAAVNTNSGRNEDDNKEDAEEDETPTAGNGSDAGISDEPEDNNSEERKNPPVVNYSAARIRNRRPIDGNFNFDEATRERAWDGIDITDDLTVSKNGRYTDRNGYTRNGPVYVVNGNRVRVAIIRDSAGKIRPKLVAV